MDSAAPAEDIPAFARGIMRKAFGRLYEPTPAMFAKVDAAQFATLQPLIRWHIDRILDRLYGWILPSVIVASAMGLSALVGLVWLPASVLYAATGSHPAWSVRIASVGAALVLLVAGWVLTPSAFPGASRRMGRGALLAMSSMAVGLSIVAALQNWQFPLLSSTAAITLLLTGGLLGFEAWGVLICGSVWAEQVDSRLTRQFSDSLVVMRLTGLLKEIQDAAKWPDPRHREAIIFSLEGTARALERAILCRKTGDRQLDARLSVDARAIAYGLRRHRRKVLLPNAQTREALAGAITDSILAVVEGRWGDLPRCRRKRASVGAMFSLVWRFVRLAVVGVTPLIVWAVINRIMPGLPFADSPAAFIGCLLWLCLYLAMGLDPGFSDRLRTFKELRSLVSPNKD